FANPGDDDPHHLLVRVRGKDLEIPAQAHGGHRKRAGRVRRLARQQRLASADLLDVAVHELAGRRQVLRSRRGGHQPHREQGQKRATRAMSRVRFHGVLRMSFRPAAAFRAPAYPAGVVRSVLVAGRPAIQRRAASSAASRPVSRPARVTGTTSSGATPVPAMRRPSGPVRSAITYMSTSPFGRRDTTAGSAWPAVVSPKSRALPCAWSPAAKISDVLTDASSVSTASLPRNGSTALPAASTRRGFATSFSS